MESYRILQISAIWVIASVTPLMKSQKVPMIKGLDCFNDFKRTMVCVWELANSSSDCSRDFHLDYTDILTRTKIPNNTCGAEQNGDVSLRNKCVCKITVEPFTPNDIYEVQVVSQGKIVDEIHFSVHYKVKPRTPLNVRVDLSEVDIGKVHWNANNQRILEDELFFDVEILSKKGRKKALDYNTIQKSPPFIFTKRQLSRGYDYTVRVRSKPSEEKTNYFKGTWSEWSAEAEWRNDYPLTFWDAAGIVITLSCFLLLIMIITSYYFINRWKNQWWNNIPDPAKSSLGTCKILQNQYRVPSERSKSTNLWGRCLKNISKAHAKSQQGQHINMYYFIREASTLQKYTQESEKDVVVSSFQLCSPEEDNLSSSQEDVSETGNEAHLLGSDLSIGKMFSDILHNSPATNMEASENWDIGHVFWDFQMQGPPDEVFPERRCLDHFEEGSGEDWQSIDRTKLHDENQDEKDLSLCAPSVGISDNRGVGEAGTFMNTAYSSFARALCNDT